jgi:hypothetical protein
MRYGYGYPQQQFDVVGAGDDEVGAILQRAALVQPQHVAVQQFPVANLRVARPAWMGPPEVPQGVTEPQEEMDFLPFDSIELTSTSNSESLVSNPQRPFRGERLIMTASYFLAAGGAPTDVGGSTVISPAIYVGATQVGATQGQTPLSTFAPNAFGVRLSLPRAGQGTRLLIPVEYLGTIAAGDKVVVTATLIGRAVR